MKIKLLAALIASIAVSGAANAENKWDSVINKNYLSDKMGSTVKVLTNVEKGSRWYTLHRLKSTVLVEDGEVKDKTLLNFRLNGNTAITDDLSFVGNFWVKAIEDNVIEDHFDDFSNIKWEEFRVGLESKTFGALTYSHHMTSWGMFATDMGVQALLDTQMDVGRKNAGKISYKNHFDNNLFVSATYDTDSGISGIDIGYQTMDIYGFAPDAFGVYASVHNGQPTVFKGSKPIVGNSNFAKSTDNSDSGFVGRDDEGLLTYSVNGYKNFGFAGRGVFGMSYSDMADGEDADSILAQGGITKGGLGFSASAGYQMIPQGLRGWSPTVYATYDEFGTSITPELSYWFGTPSLRATVAYAIHEDAENIAYLQIFLEI